MFTDEVPDRAELRAIRKHAEETFAGLLFDALNSSRICWRSRC
ncbi:hypothetical protein [Nocardia bhagyanarayanae]|nr:hypothetical protein [Nocardia bhagyanarayanae]